MMSSVLQVLVSYSSAPVDQSCLTTASILLMLGLGVKVSGLVFKYNMCMPLVHERNLSLHNITQLHVQLVSYDWWEVIFQMKAEWRSA